MKHTLYNLLAFAFILHLASVPSQAFTFDDVRKLARALAQTPYHDDTPPLPPEIDNLTYDAMRDIRWKTEYTLWKNEALPFQVQFSQRSGYLRDKITIYVVEDGRAKEFPYSSDYFTFGRTKITKPLSPNVGFGSFRIHYAINNPAYLDEVIVFGGASYFRSLAQHQVYGLSCRGLAVNSGIYGVTEEFPAFTTFWLVKPKPGDTQMTFYALLNGPSVTGAYQFVLKPGQETQAEISVSLDFRKYIQHLGVAPLTSMFWFGENTSNHFGDFRPEVHDVDGALIANGKGEWLWRPLENYPEVHFNSFQDDNPKGFGLFQRDRDFDHYQDLEVNYHLRPSCWVEPLEQWHKGSVDLVQLPIPDETIDNIGLYWEPAKAPSGGETMQFRYRLHWLMDTPSLPPLSRVLATRINHPTRLFPDSRVVIDFSAPGIDKLDDKQLPHAEVSSTGTEPIKNVQVIRNPYDHALRVSFTLPDQNKVVELRCQLVNSDRSPFSEIWTYTWHP